MLLYQFPVQFCLLSATATSLLAADRIGNLTFTTSEVIHTFIVIFTVHVSAFVIASLLIYDFYLWSALVSCDFVLMRDFRMIYCLDVC